ncbi:unnamed protein product, partial [Mycena citricolor]
LKDVCVKNRICKYANCDVVCCLRALNRVGGTDPATKQNSICEKSDMPMQGTDRHLSARPQEPSRTEKPEN